MASTSLTLKNASKPMTDYNKHSQCQSTTNQQPNTILEQSAKKLSETFPRELNIADFGCSHGLNSMTCIKAALNGYRHIKSNLSVVVYLNDLPDNDFGEVLKCLTNPDVTFENHPTLTNASSTTLLSGKSFYQRCFPPNHLNLAFSFNCLHWIETPIKLKNSLCLRTPFLSSFERRQVEAIAHNSLVQFLKHRQVEMQVGGRLVLTVLREIATLEKFDSLWKQFLGTRQLNFKDFKNLVMPAYPRSSQEIFKIIQAVPKFKKIHHDPDIVGTASFCAKTVKAASYSTMLQGVSQHPNFSLSQAQSLVDDFYQYIIPYWSDSKPIFHLLVLERT